MLFICVIYKESVHANVAGRKNHAISNRTKNYCKIGLEIVQKPLGDVYRLVLANARALRTAFVENRFSALPWQCVPHWHIHFHYLHTHITSSERLQHHSSFRLYTHNPTGLRKDVKGERRRHQHDNFHVLNKSDFIIQMEI